MCEALGPYAELCRKAGGPSRRRCEGLITIELRTQSPQQLAYILHGIGKRVDRREHRYGAADKASETYVGGGVKVIY